LRGGGDARDHHQLGEICHDIGSAFE
jgi:hypothetical protein